ncbi:MAG TPA: LytR C-terminal domain-containing protein, partial [Candidatus Saccharimonadales bacterium]|nr:LytR C-terminal domain-containing protein [Candidatus Saccharimonadales bacterium]
MFSSKPEILAFLQSDILELKGKDVMLGETLTLPKAIFRKLTVLDSEKLKEAAVYFLAKSPVKKQKVLLVLGESLVVSKNYPIAEKDTIPEKLEKFGKEEGLTTQNLSSGVVTNDKEIFIFGTNKIIYQAMLEAFSSMGWEVGAVIPISLFPALSKNKTLSIDEVNQILNDEDAVKTCNFLEEGSDVKTAQEVAVAETKPSTPAPISIPKKSGSKKWLIGCVLLLVLVVAAAFVTFGLKKGPLAGINGEKVNEVTLVPTPKATPTPTPAYTQKSDLKIHVLNGTGTAGQAKVVKDALTSAGYGNIDTANAP